MTKTGVILRLIYNETHSGTYPRQTTTAPKTNISLGGTPRGIQEGVQSSARHCFDLIVSRASFLSLTAFALVVTLSDHLEHRLESLMRTSVRIEHLGTQAPGATLMYFTLRIPHNDLGP